MKIGIIVSLIVLLITPYSFSEEKAMEMDPQMMEAMKERTSPGDAHKVFEPLVGEWDYKGNFWMSPDAEPQITMGTGKTELIYGGRFLKQHYEGPWMEEMFEGTGYVGYDNIRKEYTNVWFDNMSTGIMKMTGSYDAESKTLNFSGNYSCPLTGEANHQARSEWKLIDENSSTYTSYNYDPEGNEYKAMELTYTKKT